MIDKYIDPALLKDNAFSVVQEEVKRVFSEDEITNLKADYFSAKKAEDTRQKAKELFAQMLQNESNAMVQESLKSLSKIDFGETGLKVLKSDSAGLMKKINRGYSLEIEDVYLLQDFSVNRMVAYDASGNYLYDRPFRPDETQTMITNIRKIS